MFSKTIITEYKINGTKKYKGSIMKVSRYKRDDEVTYSLGATVTMEFLIKSPDDLVHVFFHPEFRSGAKAEIEAKCREAKIDITTDVKPFNILSQKENCFVIGVIRKHDMHISKGDHVVLVNPSNCGNLGTIIRSCAGFGVNDIAIIPPAADHFDPKTVRASMGALAEVRIEVFDSIDMYTEKFPENNLYPFMLDGSTLLQETEIKAPFSLIMGNEATGLPADFKDVGQPVRIEHTNAIDSLNLPIATSIGLYEATKSRYGRK